MYSGVGVCGVDVCVDVQITVSEIPGFVLKNEVFFGGFDDGLFLVSIFLDICPVMWTCVLSVSG